MCKENKFVDKYSTITNTAIFNISSLILTRIQKVVLGLGTKYIPYPKSDFRDHILKMTDSISTFKRQIRLASFFGHSPYIPSSIPKIENKELWHAPKMKNFDEPLELYINKCRIIQIKYFESSKSFFHDSDQLLLNTLNRLFKDTHITIKPADKNLGLVIMNTTDYKISCLQHLNDVNTYTIIHNYDKNVIYDRLITILKRHKQYDVRTVLTPIAKSLLQLRNHSSLRIAPFSTLPKIHKSITPPIPGRPIVSSNSTLTYHASVYLDKELQPTLRKLKTVCTSGRSIILHMESFKAPLGSTILCADVTSLYPNIPIDVGITTVRKVLKDLNCFTTEHLDFLMDLLHWVLTENYCTFDKTIYHQIKGTAMGTPTAVSYSNIFLYGIESPILLKYGHSYYIRYIDDVFSIFHTRELAELFIREFNSIIPSIKFEAVTNGESGVMLDLELKLIPNQNNSHLVISHTIYQKERNIYQYIPIMSEHSPHIFKNFVLQELQRYRLACTTDIEYNKICSSFLLRLTARGYPEDIFHTALKKVPSRTILMELLYLQFYPLFPTTKNKERMPILILDIPRTLPKVSWQQLFTIPPDVYNTRSYQGAYNSSKIIIGKKNSRTIGQHLIRSLYRTPT